MLCLLTISPNEQESVNNEYCQNIQYKPVQQLGQVKTCQNYPNIQRKQEKKDSKSKITLTASSKKEETSTAYKMYPSNINQFTNTPNVHPKIEHIGKQARVSRVNNHQHIVTDL